MKPPMNKALPKNAPSKPTPKVPVTRAVKRTKEATPRTMIAQPMSPDHSVSIRTEKIKNGHLVHTSQYDNNGHYKSETEFHAKPPKISIAAIAAIPSKGRAKRG
jgi:hypothetical protein